MSYDGPRRPNSYLLRHHNYAYGRHYFLTFNTKYRQQHFGHIEHGEMNLSEIGHIACEEIERTEILRDRVILPAWVVMPDHIHILLTLKPDPTEPPKRFGPRPATLEKGTTGAILSNLKAMITKRARQAGHHHFAWQRQYYDQVIRDDAHYENVVRYISQNISNW